MNSSEIFKKLCEGLRFPKETNPTLYAKNTKETCVLNEVKIEKNDEIIPEPEPSTDNKDEITLLNSFNHEEKKRAKKRKIESEDEIKRKKMLLEKEELNRYRKVNKISVFGKGIPAPAQTFNEFQIDSDLKENLIAAGFTKPTLIQQQAVPILMQDKNLLALAPTGSGKTTAYLLPIIQKLKSHKKKGFRSLILCPSRELVKQIKDECARLSKGRNFRIFTIANKKKAIAQFTSESKEKYDFLITTPGRLCLLLNQENSTLNLNTVRHVVVDEADKMFEGGNCEFSKQLRQVLEACSNENRKIAMFGATSKPSVSKWCYKNMKNLAQVSIGRRNIASLDVEQKLRFVGDDRDKLFALRDIIRYGIDPPVLIFVKTKDKARMIFKELIYDGIMVDAIHADRSEEERANTVRAFQNGKVWILICTELMARGIDFKNVNLVINFDFPRSLSTYIHMVGRSGRAGRKGAAITFYNQDDVEFLRQIAHKLVASGCEVPEYLVENRIERKKRAYKAKKAEKLKKIESKNKENATKTSKNSKNESARNKRQNGDVKNRTKDIKKKSGKSKERSNEN